MVDEMSSLNANYSRLACEATGASSVSQVDILQSLWSGYGQIVRCHLVYQDDEGPRSVVLKHVHWPTEVNHPRGWSTDRSHLRKVKSYQVELEWYQHWAHRCDDPCRVPKWLLSETLDDGVYLVLEDLDAAGFDGRRNHASAEDIHACIRWLAHFHARFMHEKPTRLWSTGTYWHLDTRPDELARLDDPALRDAAAPIDAKLAGSPFQTLVHGDAKLANFCFSKAGSVAAVDFQYVGGGCGMKDLAYFVSSCLDQDECERQESTLLALYFETLRAAIKAEAWEIDVDAIEKDWRSLYPVAWTDFFRFLQGWSPGHWKIHSYSRRLANEVLATL
ncbi:MAG: aminoglycoside phosphotransferase family protein [Myxococcota bacterium]